MKRRDLVTGFNLRTWQVAELYFILVSCCCLYLCVAYAETGLSCDKGHMYTFGLN